MSGAPWGAGLSDTPLWHDAAPPEPESGRTPPARVDVAVVGAGYTGLSCALTLAKAGRTVAVLEAGAPGAGASTRNGGMIGWGHKARLSSLAKRHGAEAATAMLRDARASLAWTTDLLARLPVDPRFRRSGRYLGAGSALHFARLAAWARDEAPALGMRVEVVRPRDQAAEIATDTYSGGLLFPDHGVLHPALFHRGLLEAARAAGAQVVDHAGVHALSGAPGGWRIATDKGPVEARDIVFAANGYARLGGRVFRQQARGLVPVPSFVIATERLGANRIASLLPGGRAYVDTRAAHSYFRADPDGERLVWGGRASLTPLPPAPAARRLRDQMLSVFPELAATRITHSWTGTVAFTRDRVPHLGRIDGVWHACGYNGSGVAMAPYLGHRLAERIVAEGAGRTALDAGRLRPHPWPAAMPWALRALEVYYRGRERLEGVARIRRH